MKPARLQPPAANFGVAAKPSLAQFSAALTANTPLPSPFHELRCQAQREALAAAEAFHRELLLLPGETRPAGLLLTGHQPELFHPGVWSKNFVLAELARRHGLTPIHLVVDADVVKAAGLRVPDLREPPGKVSLVPFDTEEIGMPYEAFRCQNRQRLASFPQRVAAHLAGVEGRPLLQDFWPRVLRFLEPAQCRLGDAFVAARHQLEVEWGVNNWELPLRRLCVTPSFARFLGLVVERPAEFQQHHNAALAEFRRRHRLRSRVHPAPDLIERAGTWEVPFWSWQTGEGIRHRLFVRPAAGRLELGIWSDGWRSLPVSWPSHAAAQAEALAELARAGWQVRSRALTTTLFARLFLGIGFIHGLGGGLYDEATDALMVAFFQVQPPPYLSLTATLRLRVTGCSDAAQRLRSCTHRLWEGRWHAEKFLAASPASAELAAAKRAWLTRQPQTRAERRERCRRLKEINRQLAELAAPLSHAWRMELEQAQAAAHFDKLCRERDWSFVLHDAEDLQRLMACVGKSEG